VKAAATSPAESVYVLRLQNEDIGTFYKYDLIEPKMSNPTLSECNGHSQKLSTRGKQRTAESETVELHT
jgi:hypothetical protein